MASPPNHNTPSPTCSVSPTPSLVSHPTGQTPIHSPKPRLPINFRRIDSLAASVPTTSISSPSTPAVAGSGAPIQQQVTLGPGLQRAVTLSASTPVVVSRTPTPLSGEFDDAAAKSQVLRHQVQRPSRSQTLQAQGIQRRPAIRSAANLMIGFRSQRPSLSHSQAEAQMIALEPIAQPLPARVYGSHKPSPEEILRAQNTRHCFTDSTSVGLSSPLQQISRAQTFPTPSSLSNAIFASGQSYPISRDGGILVRENRTYERERVTAAIASKMHINSRGFTPDGEWRVYSLDESKLSHQNDQLGRYEERIRRDRGLVRMEIERIQAKEEMLLREAKKQMERDEERRISLEASQDDMAKQEAARKQEKGRKRENKEERKEKRKLEREGWCVIQ